MTGLFERILLPVASEEDAKTTCDVALDHVADARGRVVAVHVVEKGGGVPDKASVEQREERAADILSVVLDRCDAAGIPVETELTYGTNVAKAIFDVADDVDATAIVFSPRSGSRWIQLLTGDVAHTLVTETDRPIVVLPDTETN